MKISREQKEENRRVIVRAAVDLMTEKGFKSATMRDIARMSQMSDATIYHYFPTKESILFAYYEDHMIECIDTLRGISDYNTYSFQEQVQTLVETSLDRLNSDRAFVALSYKQVFLSSLGLSSQEIDPIRNRFVEAVRDMLDAAVEVGEIPASAFPNLVVQLFWDYYLGVLAYWLADTSKKRENTTVLIDKTLDLATALLQSGVLNKVFDLAVVLFKSHVLSRLPNLNNFDHEIRTVKRKFMGDSDDDPNP